MTRGMGRQVAISGPRLGTKLSTNVINPNTYAICTPKSHSIAATTVATNKPTCHAENPLLAMGGCTLALSLLMVEKTSLKKHSSERGNTRYITPIARYYVYSKWQCRGRLASSGGTFPHPNRS